MYFFIANILKFVFIHENEIKMKSSSFMFQNSFPNSNNNNNIFTLQYMYEIHNVCNGSSNTF